KQRFFTITGILMLALLHGHLNVRTMNKCIIKINSRFEEFEHDGCTSFNQLTI
ncbi:MAG: hypothetical protein JNM51_11565, partial [Bacteroidia bacterium]|nr:hypothetical protein [Bacteroidia bacterium]